MSINVEAKEWVIAQLASVGIVAEKAKKGLLATLPDGSTRRIQVAARSTEDNAADVGAINELNFDYYIVVPVRKSKIEWGFIFSVNEIRSAPLYADAMTNHAFSRDLNPSKDGKIHVWQAARRYRKPKCANAWHLIV
ncbi:MAG: hypothetical protein AABZ45_00990 [Pseudomonadota bacterium]